MELREKVVLDIVESDNYYAPILTELAEVLARRPDVLHVVHKKKYIEQTKSEINIGIEFLFAIGTSILSSVIYDILKNIWRNCRGKSEKLRLKISSHESTEIIELRYDNTTRDIDIHIEKVQGKQP